jgi:hypothetical protein
MKSFPVTISSTLVTSYETPEGKLLRKRVKEMLEDGWSKVETAANYTNKRLSQEAIEEERRKLVAEEVQRFSGRISSLKSEHESKDNALRQQFIEVLYPKFFGILSEEKSLGRYAEERAFRMNQVKLTPEILRETYETAMETGDIDFATRLLDYVEIFPRNETDWVGMVSRLRERHKEKLNLKEITSTRQALAICQRELDIAERMLDLGLTKSANRLGPHDLQRYEKALLDAGVAS